MGLNDDLVVAIHPSHLWASFICGTDKLKLQTNKKKKVMTLSFLKLVYSSVATLLSPSLKLYGFLLSRMIWKAILMGEMGALIAVKWGIDGYKNQGQLRALVSVYLDL
ncbi:hypothetical protein AAZX31_05G025100 [Glycine max]